MRICLFALCIAMAIPASAQSVADLVPAQATHCALTEPPAKAGLAGTPGGFVMVFPRNDALTDTFTGCKLLWVLDGDNAMRFATLYFKNGKLSVAIAHDVRDSAGAIAGACALPEGKSLLPTSGRQISDEACKGFTEDDFYALRLPTWPRSCLTDTRAAVCAADPRLETVTTVSPLESMHCTAAQGRIPAETAWSTLCGRSIERRLESLHGGRPSFWLHSTLRPRRVRDEATRVPRSTRASPLPAKSRGLPPFLRSSIP